MTSGNISAANGDFQGIVQGYAGGTATNSAGIASYPNSNTGPGAAGANTAWNPATFPQRVSGVGGGPAFVPAVQFDYRTYGIPQRLGTAGSTNAKFGGLFGGSNWTFEYWIQSFAQVSALLPEIVGGVLNCGGSHLCAAPVCSMPSPDVQRRALHHHLLLCPLPGTHSRVAVSVQLHVPERHDDIVPERRLHRVARLAVGHAPQFHVQFGLPQYRHAPGLWRRWSLGK